MDHDNHHNGIHADHVRQSLEELQQMVKDHEAALSRLRASTVITRHAAEASLDIMKNAYDDLATKTPFLPYPNSVLPALIALRKTHQIVEDTKAYLPWHGETVEKAKGRFEVELSNLRDQQALSQSLQGRIQTLRNELDNRMELGPEDIARERITDLKQKKRNYDKKTSKLLQVLRMFIDDHLASMLAAEELGGPVVGDMINIESDDLAAGFSTQGHLKKAKANQDQDKRQQRIDEIWERQEPQPQDKHERNESTAAGEAMRHLTEELLNSLAESEGDNSAAYVQLARESAAARFLVRSKVAQFHHKDSRKLRLVDFGKDLED